MKITDIMIGIINGKIKRVPLAECAGKLKSLPKIRSRSAKQIGISSETESKEHDRHQFLEIKLRIFLQYNRAGDDVS